MRRKTALLHIGTPKTGTTSIQNCLKCADASGALGTYRYPLQRLSHRNQDQLLSTLYLSQEDRRAQRRCRRFLSRTLQSAEDVILASNMLGSRFGLPDVIRLRGDLESLGFQEFCVVLYIRDAADSYLSRTQQRLKMPAVTDSVDTIIDPLSFNYGFRLIAANWETAFPGSVIVRPYPNSPADDVVADFSALLQSRLGVTLPPFATRLNTTLSAEALVVIQNHRQAVAPAGKGRLIPGLGRLVAFLMKSRQIVPHQSRPILKIPVAEQIRAEHRADAEFIHSRYGVDLGMRTSGPSAPIAPRPSWRIEDVLESVDRGGPATGGRIPPCREFGPAAAADSSGRSGLPCCAVFASASPSGRAVADPIRLRTTGMAPQPGAHRVLSGPAVVKPAAVGEWGLRRVPGSWGSDGR